MTRVSPEHRDRFTGVQQALQASLIVPTDTYITEDMPLLLTKLSRISAAKRLQDEAE